MFKDVHNHLCGNKGLPVTMKLVGCVFKLESVNESTESKKNIPFEDGFVGGKKGCDTTSCSKGEKEKHSS